MNVLPEWSSRSVRWGVLLGTCLAMSGLLTAEEDRPDAEAADAPRREYIRIARNERGLAVAMQTPVIRFAHSDRFPGRVVDLIGAVHLGERSYYEELNRRFADYDVLLYEAVIPEKALKRGLRPGQRRNGRFLSDDEAWTESKIGLATISTLQLAMKDVLGLEFQLSAIDYTPDHFVHADMTQEEMEASMNRRGESFSEMLAREMLRATISQQQKNPIAQNLDALLSLLAPDRKYRVRRIAAVEMVDASTGDVFAGADGTSTIITERNIRALEVLQRELKHPSSRVAGLFYGAGHFADMEQRLISDLGFQRVSEEWITAWHLRPPAETGGATDRKNADSR